jgi:hypothetical protein
MPSIFKVLTKDKAFYMSVTISLFSPGKILLSRVYTTKIHYSLKTFNKILITKKMQNISKWTKNLNVKHKTIKILEENVDWN